MGVRYGAAIAILAGSAAWASQETRAAGESQEFKLTPAAAEGIEFPFETNAEAGGGGCAPPARHPLGVSAAASVCIKLAGREVAVATEANRITVDTNGDGKVDQVVKGEEGTVTLQLSYAGGEKSAYTVRLFGDGSGAWSYDRWGYMTGKVHGTTLVLVDENANGFYNEAGKDRMVVGDGAQAHPLSPIVNLAGKLYELTIEPSGARVHTRPYTGEVGVLDLASKFESKAKLVSAVVKSGKNCFDVAGKPITVPAGEYALFSGVVSSAPQLAHLKRGGMAPFVVEAGKTTTLEWGMPVAIQFKHEFKDEEVTIQPDQIHIRGQKGEEYFAFKPMAFTPTVVVRDMRSDAVVQKGTMVLG
jgi:hypothetical protein